MDAILIVKFHGLPVQFGELNAGRTVFNLVDADAQATRFRNFREALTAIVDYRLKPDSLVTVEKLRAEN